MIELTKLTAKFILLFIAINAFPFVVYANEETQSVIVAENDTVTNYVTVSGQVYYLKRGEKTGIKTGVKNAAIKIDDYVVTSDASGYYSFRCKKGSELSMTVTCPYDEDNDVHYYVPGEVYTLTANVNKKYNIQVVKSDEDGVAPMGKVTGTVLAKIADTLNSNNTENIKISKAIVKYTTTIENYGTLTYFTTADQDGVYDFVDEDGNNRLMGNLYYHTLIMDSERGRYSSISFEDRYVFFTDGTFTLDAQLLEYAKFNVKVWCDSSLPSASADIDDDDSDYDPLAVTLDFYNWYDEYESNPMYNQVLLNSDGTYTNASVGDYYGYYVHAKKKGYYQTEFAHTVGANYVNIDDFNWLELKLYPERTGSVVCEPMIKSYNKEYYIQISFSGHPLTYNDNGKQIYLKYKNAQSSSAPARTVTAESRADIPMYAEQGDDGVINVYLDHDKGAPYELLDKTNYELVMPEQSVVIDSYIYDWELTYDVPVSVGVPTIGNEQSTLVDVFTMSGVLVERGIEESSIHDLPSGLYIVRGATRAYKYLQR
jgi:hypothetical protein